MSKIIALINGHPDPAPERFCHALADAYDEGARNAGHMVTRINIASIDFPLLRNAREFKDGPVAPPIAQAQEAIKAAHHIVIIYPLWLGTMPALLKGFLEQCIRPGFAFTESADKWPSKLLKGRSARIVVTMGMPRFIYRWYYFSHSLRSLERNILKFSGISPVRETILGMVEAVDDKKRKSWLADMKALGNQGI